MERAAKDPNTKLPSALETLPTLTTETAYYYDVFTKLRRCWQPAMGHEPIPMSEITGYCEFLDDDDPEMFVEVITGADAVYMNYARKKAETK